MGSEEVTGSGQPDKCRVARELCREATRLPGGVWVGDATVVRAVGEGIQVRLVSWLGMYKR